MLRIVFIVAVLVFCVFRAPVRDPRLNSAINDASLGISQQLRAYPDGRFYCPMDPDIRSASPGFGPRCGMKLVEGVQDTSQYPVNLKMEPSAPRAAENVRLTFAIDDPATHRPLRSFEIVHEKLYHLFVVSQDLAFFLHTHPERNANEDFHLDMRFPRAGMYRVLSDFYPSGGTPQLTANTVLVQGDGFRLQPANLKEDTSPRRSENARVELMAAGVIAGETSSLLFRITPNESIEPYLGAMAHALAVSADLADMMLAIRSRSRKFRQERPEIWISEWFFREPACTASGYSFSERESSTRRPLIYRLKSGDNTAYRRTTTSLPLGTPPPPLCATIRSIPVTPGPSSVNSPSASCSPS
jgi:hypothetical protein